MIKVIFYKGGEFLKISHKYFSHTTIYNQLRLPLVLPCYVELDTTITLLSNC